MEGKKKSLEQMLFEFAGQPTASNSAKNYKVFMEHWDEIQAEHQKGWSYLMIWKAMTAASALTFSYPTFTSYIRKVERRQEKAVLNKGPQQRPVKIGRAEVGQGNPSPTKVDLPSFGGSAEQRKPRHF
ncbi:MAG: TraK family protein [Planctomycetaceae bacterium]|nr:TraK family protein [Planctomycetaceae bacterium]